MNKKPTYHELEQHIARLEMELDQIQRGRNAALAGNGQMPADVASAFLYGLINNTQNVIYAKSTDGKFILVNKAFYEIFGFQENQVIGKTPFDLFPGDIASQHVENDRQVTQSKAPFTFTEQAMHADGRHDYISVKFPILDGAGWVIAIGGISTDITERVRMEEKLRDSEELFRLAFQTSPDAINLNRVNGGVYIDINEGFTALTGYTREEVIGDTAIVKDIWENPADRKRLIEGLSKKGFVKSLEARFVRKSGEVAVGLLSARILRIKDEEVMLSITRDITELKEAEAEKEKYRNQIIQAQKMESIGTLAGGIAHDFNNLLMGIQGRASIMSIDLEAAHTCMEHVQAILEYTKSAADLTKQLLGVAQGGKYETAPIDVNEVIHSSATLFGRTKKEIRIHQKLCAPPPVVVADRRQIEQVLLNMFINAWQSMPRGGNIYLETSIVTLEAAYCAPYSVAPGPFTRISVTDTGIGMDEATRRQVFDPFFTTKEKGRGTGLGLASAYGIVKNHGGFINVYSEPGKGSTFNIYLPVSQDKAWSQDLPVPELAGGSERVLLIDDEQMILDVGTAMLEKLGYRVTCALGGRQAVGVASANTADYDLVILDMIMPDLNGEKVFDILRKIRPSLPILLSSGYSLNGQAAKIMKKGCNGFIQKPFNLFDLSMIVRRILDKGSDGIAGNRPSDGLPM
ncbi:MAG: PAS domain S-box protein [Desulfobacterales bacterium]|nr:PAS domain S-box protein [Desulfobacterales bacterium]